MKILFINKFLDRDTIYRVPLGILYLSSAIKGAKHHHQVFICEPKRENVFNKMQEIKPDVVAYSLRTGFHQYYLDLNRKLKKQFDFLSIFGGPHPTFFPETIKEDGVDCIARGEGESSFVDLLDRLAENKPYFETKNFWFKVKGEIFQNPLRELEQDLDKIAFPDRKLLDYFKEIRLSKVHNFIATRGCPFNCSYCFNHSLKQMYDGQRYVRRRSVDNLMKEIKQVAGYYPLTRVHFEDDTFILDKLWLKEFVAKYPKIPFKCSVRANLVDEEIIQLLKKANCISVSFGIEAGNDRIRNEILRRQMTKEQIINCARLLKKYGIKFISQNILASPTSTLADDSGGHMLPLSFGYLASYARKKISGLEFEILDCEVEGLNYQQIEKRVKNAKPDVVGITAPTPTMKHINKISEIIKKLYPDTIIAAGGTHPTVLPERTMEEIKEIDFIIIGEGELTFSELLQALKEGRNDFSNIAGLCWRKENKTIVNQRRELIKNLDEIPFPARDIFNLEFYYSAPTKKMSEESATPIVTSRGCPFNCIHCPSRIIWEGHVRYRSCDNVVAEIEECVNQYNIREFNFFDDTFTVNKERVIEICNKVIEKKLRIYWICFARANMIDDELVRAMKMAGCKKISFGLESGSQEVLDLMRKKTTIEQGKKAVETVKKQGLETHAGFMLGNIGETTETIKKTINFAKSLDLDNATFFITCPFPGTDLYQIARKLGNINENTKWESFAPLTVQQPILVQNNLTGEELIYWQKKAFRQFYLRPKYIIKRLHRLRSIGEIKSLLEGVRIFSRILFKK